MRNQKSYIYSLKYPNKEQIRMPSMLYAQLLQPRPTLCDSWTTVHKAPLSLEFPRQEYWSALLFPSPGNLPDLGIQPASLALEASSLRLSHQGSQLECQSMHYAGDVKGMGSVPGLGRSPLGWHGSPIWYSCLENPTDREAWQATVHRVSQSQTQYGTHAL